MLAVEIARIPIAAAQILTKTYSPRRRIICITRGARKGDHRERGDAN